MVIQMQFDEAKGIVAKYVIAAAATGTVPIPASSAAIVVQNAIMISHIASSLGVQITIQNVMESMNAATLLNIAGRNLFIEAAKLLSWGTGSVWAATALSTVGATTAGLQTYIIGCIVIEIAENSGKPLTTRYAKKVISDCKSTYDSFIASAKWMKKV